MNNKAINRFIRICTSIALASGIALIIVLMRFGMGSSSIDSTLTWVIACAYLLGAFSFGTFAGVVEEFRRDDGED